MTHLISLNIWLASLGYLKYNISLEIDNAVLRFDSKSSNSYVFRSKNQSYSMLFLLIISIINYLRRI